MSVKVMARVWAHSQTAGGELLVMLALADFANDAEECWPSIPVLAQKARLTERQTRRVVAKLEQVGEIRRSKSTGGRNRRNHYFITLTENPDIITGKELQGKNNPVIGDTKTLTPMSGALNRHRTVNKRWSDANALSHSPAPNSEHQREGVRAAGDDFEQVWAAYPKRAGSNSKQDARKAWAARVRSGVDPAELAAGVERYAKYMRATGKEGTEYVKQAATFFGLGEHWKESWETPANSGRSTGGFAA